MVPDAGRQRGRGPGGRTHRPLGPGAHLHVSGYALLNDGPATLPWTRRRLARLGGATVSVDAASSGPTRGASAP